jgi:hypothetical protein
LFNSLLSLAFKLPCLFSFSRHTLIKVREERWRQNQNDSFPIQIWSVAPVVGKHLTSSEIDSPSTSSKLKLGNKNGCKETN